MNRRATKLWVGRILLAIVGPLFWLEVALQVGALFTPDAPSDASRTATPAATPADPCCVLCVGDSYTFGVGASNNDGSYPARLEAALRAAPLDGRWRVANYGVPGRNSRDLLLELPRQVQREHPRYAVILVGINDTWSRPERADLAAAARDVGMPVKWHFEWRTRKFLQLLVNTPKGGLFRGDAPRAATERASLANRASAKPAEKPAANPASKPPAVKKTRSNDVQTAYDVVGSWRSGGETIRFARDGRGARGATEVRWRIARAGELLLQWDDARPEGGKAEVHLKAQRRGMRLVLTPVDGTTPVVFEWVAGPDDGSAKPPPPAGGWYPEFARLRDSGDVPGAFALTERWIAAEPDDPAARLSRIDAANRLHNRDPIAGDVREVERIHRDVATRDSAEALCYAYELVNQPKRAGELVREELKRFPESLELHFRFAEACDREGDIESAVREMDEVIERGDDTPCSFLAWKYRERARWNVMLKRNLAAACDVVRSVRAEPDAKTTLQLLLRVTFDETCFDEAFAQTEATAEEQAFVRARLTEASEARSAAPPRHLADHLTQIVRWLRDQGVEPLLCTYPFRDGSLMKVQRAVAGRENVRLVEITARFDELLKSHAHEELFVPDGHCTDAGYRVIADEVAAALRTQAR